jgi:hypothetical protein
MIIMPLFTIEELDALDERQLKMLRDAVMSEVHSSPEIQEILKAKMRPLYDQLRRQGRQGQARRPRSPRADPTN